jgi:putative colanic acid biosynthesis glycosyltransferase WcaI
MLDVLRKRGAEECKLRYFPNGTDRVLHSAKGRFRALNRFSPDTFLVVYSGNLGVKQGLERLILAMRLVTNPRIQLIVCGEGPAKQHLLVSAAGLRNVWFEGLQEPANYKEMLVDADLMVVSLASGSGNSFFPSKLLSACAAGKPVLAICDIDSELAVVVDRNRCGVVVAPGNPEGIAQRLEQLSGEPEQLESMGRAAKKFGDQFLWSAVLERFVDEAGILD